MLQENFDEDNRLREIGQMQTNSCMILLTNGIKIVKLIEAESRMVFARHWGKRNGVIVKGTKFQLCRMSSSGDLLYSMVTIVSNTVLYMGNSLRE